MDREASIRIYKGLAGFYMMGAFLYIIFVIKPFLYFHHVQPPFLATGDFLAGYSADPGGLAQWLSLLIMQGFYPRIPGLLLFFLVAWAQWKMALLLLNRIHRSTVNILLALIPFTFSIALVNNYNLPYSVIIAQFPVLLFIWLLSLRPRGIFSSLLIYSAGALVTWYVSGSAYLLLYALTSLFFTVKKGNNISFLIIPWVLGTAALLPMLSGQNYLWFYPGKVYFMAYEPSILFYIYLSTLPLIFLLTINFSGLKLQTHLSVVFASVFLICLALAGHLLSFKPDAMRIVKSDYYCYQHDTERVAKAAMNLENYSFAANLNYNLAISRSGELTERFFDFFQISGSDALQPDVDFSPEMLFIAADLYYDLGYISEARHNAYEALVYYPHSPRALQILVKVHLVCAEYKAAERCLRILDKGLISKKFVKEYWPFIQDTSLLASNEEFIEKRAFMPAEKELSPYIDQRLKDLLEANPENNLAYEYLMLYHLLEGELEPFLEMYKQAGDYFDRTLEVYEEAILMYGMMTLTEDVADEYQLSQTTLDRFEAFGRTVNRYEDNPTMARNVLYHEMGQSYFYYLGYLFPRIVKPERAKEEYDEAPI